jgi:hypothetical protein
MSNHDELYAYRSKLLTHTLAMTREFCSLCRQIPDPFQSLTPDGWSVHQMAAHVRDVDRQVYGARLRRAVAEEHPVFKNFDGETWLAEHYNRDEPLEDILEEFQNSIHALVGWLSSLPPADWSRPTRHEVYGEFAMQAWAERGLAHIEEHIHSIADALEKSRSA